MTGRPERYQRTLKAAAPTVDPAYPMPFMRRWFRAAVAARAAQAMSVEIPSEVIVFQVPGGGVVEVADLLRGVNPVEVRA